MSYVLNLHRNLLWVTPTSLTTPADPLETLCLILLNPDPVLKHKDSWNLKDPMYMYKWIDKISKKNIIRISFDMKWMYPLHVWGSIRPSHFGPNNVLAQLHHRLTTFWQPSSNILCVANSRIPGVPLYCPITCEKEDEGKSENIILIIFLCEFCTQILNLLSKEFARIQPRVIFYLY